MHSPQRPAMILPRRGEIVALISAVMMTVALAIDSMLPAMPEIGRALGVANPADWQLIIAVFFAGFSVSQLCVGTLTDAWGRRTILLVGLFAYTATSVMAAIAPSFELLLVARFVQGMAAAIGQVVIRSITRDLFAGRDMAQVMSLSATIFMMAPILAPAIGQLVLEFAAWPWIFGLLAFFGAVILLWVSVRLPETLTSAERVPLDWLSIKASARTVLSDRMSVGYGLVGALMSVSMIGFLLSVQQIFDQRFGVPSLLPAGFALMASSMAAGSLSNAFMVKRFGMRRIGHLALMFFTGVAGVHLLVALSGAETLWVFVGLQSLMMIGFAFAAGNFSAMAMENMAPVAGMASSLQGSIANFIGIIFGVLVGRAFDGTTVPLYSSYFLCGLLALAVIYVTEGGRFFVARNAQQSVG